LARRIRASYDSIPAILNVFQWRLSPDQIAVLLDLQESLAKSLVDDTSFPEMLGVDADSLPQTKTRPQELRGYGCKSAADEIQMICNSVKTLSDFLNP